MSKEKIDNFIEFCWLFTSDYSNIWSRSSPDYIWEKWNKYIGLIPKEIEFKKNQSILDWCGKFKVSEEDYLKIKNVVYFLYEITDNTPPEKFYLNYLISKLYECTGLTIYDINTSRYKNIHPILKKRLENDFLTKPINKSVYRDFLISEILRK